MGKPNSQKKGKKNNGKKPGVVNVVSGTKRTLCQLYERISKDAVPYTERTLDLITRSILESIYREFREKSRGLTKMKDGKPSRRLNSEKLRQLLECSTYSRLFRKCGYSSSTILHRYQLGRLVEINSKKKNAHTETKFY